ncbi:MAG: bifunctional biotin--[acetyl-CoA-carboxylase] ligase/biotin operon repressor BirA [Proteobacteria bacterium]|nr:bifunctional biotin--[acetyl-CoA-carboxylase] ligase/biotin operon repressor BirA [Pseudomonadota bacterium]
MAIEPAALLATLSADHAVSGAELAHRLGVTRAAVWKQIEHLRALGAPIEALGGRGYRLAWPLEMLDADRIRSALDGATRKRLSGLATHWQIDSTSSELQRRATSAKGVEVCLAERQNAGRGRRGRVWQSPLGGNVYLSLLRRFEAGMAAMSGLSLVVGIAVVEALGDCGVAGIGLKWPNDVLVDGRKLAGILVELGGEFLGPCHAVIGIGINLRLPQETRAQIDQPAIDVASLGGEMPSRNRLAARLIARLIEAIDRFEAQGFAAFVDTFARYDALSGRDVRVLAAKAVQEGVACGVDARGALIVRHGKATTHYDSADVSVRAA